MTMSDATAGVTPAWSLVGVVVEGNAIDVRGLNPWDSHWTSTGRTIAVAHPSYPSQRHSADVCRATAPSGREVIFAVAELSNSVYAFFVPDH